MKTITINGVTFTTYGINNYSDGMELISCYPMPKNMVEDVLKGKYPNVWLNPSAECSDPTDNFYGVYGTRKQYEVFYKHQRESQISKMTICKFGGIYSYLEAPSEERATARINAEKFYKDWWKRSKDKKYTTYEEATL